MEAIAERNEGVRRAVTKFRALIADENSCGMAEICAEQDRLLRERLDHAKARGRAKGRAERDAEIARHMADIGKTDAEIAEILGGV
jgi:hypothetical protein